MPCLMFFLIFLTKNMSLSDVFSCFVAFKCDKDPEKLLEDGGVFSQSSQISGIARFCEAA